MNALLKSRKSLKITPAGQTPDSRGLSFGVLSVFVLFVGIIYPFVKPAFIHSLTVVAEP